MLYKCEYCNFETNQYCIFINHENQKSECKTKCNIYGFVYLLQTRESRQLNENVYKIGRTHQAGLQRFNNYPNGSLLKFHAECSDAKSMERKLINIFSEKFKNVSLYGTEYFEGDPNEMMKIIYQETNCYFNDVQNVNSSVLDEINKVNIELESQKNINVEYCNKIKHLIKRLSKYECIDYSCKKLDINLDTNSITNQKIFDLSCCKCNKVFTRKCSKQKHESKCIGIHSLQCNICLKSFASKYGKYEHKKNVKCNPPNS
jgi:hypothetical protein